MGVGVRSQPHLLTCTLDCYRFEGALIKQTEKSGVAPAWFHPRVGRQLVTSTTTGERAVGARWEPSDAFNSVEPHSTAPGSRILPAVITFPLVEAFFGFIHTDVLFEPCSTTLNGTKPQVNGSERYDGRRSAPR